MHTKICMRSKIVVIHDIKISLWGERGRPLDVVQGKQNQSSSTIAKKERGQCRKRFHLCSPQTEGSLPCFTLLWTFFGVRVSYCAGEEGESVLLPRSLFFNSGFPSPAQHSMLSLSPTKKIS